MLYTLAVVLLMCLCCTPWKSYYLCVYAVHLGSRIINVSMLYTLEVVLLCVYAVHLGSRIINVSMRYTLEVVLLCVYAVHLGSRIINVSMLYTLAVVLLMCLCCTPWQSYY